MGVFVLSDSQGLVALTPSEFLNEDDFQQLLEQHPTLLSRAGAARVQVPESRENTVGLRVWSRQHRALGYPGRARGSHFCFTAENAAAVDAFHAAALRSGGQDNGAPGLRPIYGPDYYAAFIIDPDGYRIEAYYGPTET
jgi:catechol 2,3-dioxygenase-like lactoylglutathione lyase family enzyme